MKDLTTGRKRGPRTKRKSAAMTGQKRLHRSGGIGGRCRRVEDRREEKSSGEAENVQPARGNFPRDGEDLEKARGKKKVIRGRGYFEEWPRGGRKKKNEPITCCGRG